MVIVDKELDSTKRDHKVTFTLTVALAFPSGELFFVYFFGDLTHTLSPLKCSRSTYTVNK